MLCNGPVVLGVAGSRPFQLFRYEDVLCLSAAGFQSISDVKTLSCRNEEKHIFDSRGAVMCEGGRHTAERSLDYGLMLPLVVLCHRTRLGSLQL